MSGAFLEVQNYNGSEARMLPVALYCNRLYVCTVCMHTCMYAFMVACCNDLHFINFCSAGDFGLQCCGSQAGRLVLI